MRQLTLLICLLCSTAVIGQPVNPAGSGSNTNSDSGAFGGGLIATLEVDRTRAYVNEQIVVTLQISAPSVAFNITGENLALKNADVVSLNRQQSTADINGIPHQFTKTVFALFAREAGTLQIPALSFKAVLPVSAGGQMSSNGNPVITASTSALDVVIESEPISEAAWFPAQRVDVESHWSVDITASDAIRAGEPVTRHVSIKVAGQHPGAIPAFQTTAIEGVRTYPDVPRLETEVAITGLNGTLTQSYAIVASRSGSVTLPPIDIHWWNINDRQWQTTTLPAEQLQVAASTLAQMPLGQSESRRYKIALAGMAMALVGLLACCFALWRRNHQLRVESMPEYLQTQKTERAAWATLQNDIRTKDCNSVRRSLIQWAHVQWPEHSIQRFDQIPIHDTLTRECLLMLDEHLYGGKTPAAPDLGLLNQKLRKIRKAARKNDKTMDGLSVLYPSS